MSDDVAERKEENRQESIRMRAILKERALEADAAAAAANTTMNPLSISYLSQETEVAMSREEHASAAAINMAAAGIRDMPEGIPKENALRQLARMQQQQQDSPRQQRQAFQENESESESDAMLQHGGGGTHNQVVDGALTNVVIGVGIPMAEVFHHHHPPPPAAVAPARLSDDVGIQMSVEMDVMTGQCGTCTHDHHVAEEEVFDDFNDSNDADADADAAAAVVVEGDVEEEESLPAELAMLDEEESDEEINLEINRNSNLSFNSV